MRSKRFYIISAILLGICTIFTCIALGFGLSHAVKRTSAAEQIIEDTYQTSWYNYSTSTTSDEGSTNDLWLPISFSYNITWKQNTSGLSIIVLTQFSSQKTIQVTPSTSFTETSMKTMSNDANSYVWIYTKLTDNVTTAKPDYSHTIYDGTNTTGINWKDNGRGTITNFYFGSNVLTIGVMGRMYTGTSVTQNYDFGFRQPSPEDTDDYYQMGYNAGVQSQQGNISDAYNQGYNAGHAAGAAGSTNLGNILLSVGGVPFETLKSMLDFDLLGVNISSLIMSILTAAVAIWLVKLFI